MLAAPRGSGINSTDSSVLTVSAKDVTSQSILLTYIDSWRLDPPSQPTTVEEFQVLCPSGKCVGMSGSAYLDVPGSFCCSVSFRGLFAKESVDIALKMKDHDAYSAYPAMTTAFTGYGRYSGLPSISSIILNSTGIPSSEPLVFEVRSQDTNWVFFLPVLFHSFISISNWSQLHLFLLQRVCATRCRGSSRMVSFSTSLGAPFSVQLFYLLRWMQLQVPHPLAPRGTTPTLQKSLMHPHRNF